MTQKIFSPKISLSDVGLFFGRDSSELKAASKADKDYGDSDEYIEFSELKKLSSSDFFTGDIGKLATLINDFTLDKNPSPIGPDFNNYKLRPRRFKIPFSELQLSTELKNALITYQTREYGDASEPATYLWDWTLEHAQQDRGINGKFYAEISKARSHYNQKHVIRDSFENTRSLVTGKDGTSLVFTENFKSSNFKHQAQVVIKAPANSIVTIEAERSRWSTSIVGDHVRGIRRPLVYSETSPTRMFVVPSSGQIELPVYKDNRWGVAGVKDKVNRIRIFDGANREELLSHDIQCVNGGRLG